MKSIVGIYLLIGLLFTPLIYSNNGGGFTHGGAYGIGQAIGKSTIYWPSYVLAWEPEIDGDSDEAFSSSITNMLKWRREKWFASDGPHAEMLLASVGMCILLDSNSPGKKQDAYSLFQKLFSENSSNLELAKLREEIRDRFDGMDYKDALEEGDDCRKELEI